MGVYVRRVAWLGEEQMKVKNGGFSRGKKGNGVEIRDLGGGGGP